MIEPEMDEVERIGYDLGLQFIIRLTKLDQPFALASLAQTVATMVDVIVVFIEMHSNAPKDVLIDDVLARLAHLRKVGERIQAMKRTDIQ
jgi:hypothetical protein